MRRIRRSVSRGGRRRGRLARALASSSLGQPCLGPQLPQQPAKEIPGSATASSLPSRSSAAATPVPGGTGSCTNWTQPGSPTPSPAAWPAGTGRYLRRQRDQSHVAGCGRAPRPAMRSVPDVPATTRQAPQADSCGQSCGQSRGRSCARSRVVNSPVTANSEVSRDGLPSRPGPRGGHREPHPPRPPDIGPRGQPTWHG